MPEPGSVALAEWVWCLHCEQAHSREEWESRDLRCPVPDCDGNALDAMPWEMIRAHHADYPQVLEAGAQYPMY